MIWFLIFLLYVVPALFLIGYAVAACFSKRVSEYTYIHTRADAIAVFFVGLTPFYNVFVTVWITYNTFIKQWLHDFGHTKLHK